MIILPNSTCNCSTMLGLYLCAKHASSRHDSKEKGGGGEYAGNKSMGAEAILFK